MATVHIVLGLDGSPGSEAAREWCIRHAPKLGADVTAVHVVGPLIEFVPPVTGGALPFTSDEALHRDLAMDLERWSAPLRDAGVECRTELLDGEPAEAIAELAARVDADLVVVGRHGANGAVLVGSVPGHLARDCPRPVLVVPEPIGYSP